MIIFGNPFDVIRLGEAERYACQICGQETPHSFRLNYQYFHIYYLFGFTHYRQYWLVCDRCQNGLPAQKEGVPLSLRKPDKVPFMKRYGRFVGPPILFVVAVSLGWFLMEFVIR